MTFLICVQSDRAETVLHITTHSFDDWHADFTFHSAQNILPLSLSLSWTDAFMPRAFFRHEQSAVSF